ncbi:TonB-dependent receptor [Dyella tabacisoli]|uniref:TonB-dependent receptor n=1 Tax=Dyella tabacisoli TaxID=2282381 RepID=A0A369UV00_9GAMM|nr:TonB-dependent receptor [Dyella tabacisoli]RDD82179.1 TonB-dependent receptor [Dyella tabacisoli]
MSNCRQFKRRILAMAIGAMLTSGVIHAQDTAAQTTPAADQGKQKPSATQPVQTLNQVVVTGNSTAGGIRRIDASYSITTATRDQIKELNPVSVSDLLKVSPGVYPESSGGQTGANIEVAGFPSDSGAPFVTLQMNGSPLFPKWDYFTDAMFRLDDTIDRVEALQGGPSVLYGNGQPGLIANFILREGSSVPSGDVGLTYGSEGMVRLDGFYGFPIGGKNSGWYGSIGGFWRKSDGVRDPQFAADKGGQLTATLSHDLEHGSIMFYARDLKDKNQFVTDTPILNPAPGKFSPYPGFSPLTGTFGSNADRRQFFETTPCFTAGCSPGGINVDMANGQGGDVHILGANLDLSFDNGWALSDKFIFVAGNMDTSAFFSTGANPSTLGGFISDSATAFGLPSNLQATATYTNGKAANLNENVTIQNPEYIHKRIQSVSNEFHLSKELFEGNTLTFGNYTAVFSEHHSENDGANQLLQAKSNPNPIVVNLSDGTNNYALTDKQGLYWNSQPQSWMAFNESWHATTTAFFLADEWNVGNWRFDGGARIQHDDIGGRFQNTTSGDLDNNPYTVYNNNAEYLSNSFRHVSGSRNAPSWTLGANYALSKNMSLYARINDGVFLPSFDDMVNLQSPPVEKIHNMELGFKYQSPWIFADISAYRRLFHGVPYSIQLASGQVNLVYGSVTKGLNAQVTVTPFEHFSVALSGNYMDGHYSGYASCVPYVGQDGSNLCSSINGMRLDRQPKLQYRLTPSYVIPTAWGNMKLWVTYEHMGDRYGDQLQQQPLGSYYALSFGAAANIGEHWALTLRGTNMTNQIGITEGNARLFGFASGGGVILARSIEGREVNFQAKYKF